MRFDASIFWNHLKVVPWHEQVDQARNWTQALERLGFTAAWSSEHHFMPGIHGSPPNALIAGADVLAHTTTLRFGGAPWAILDRHPLMVAEDAAMVDHQSLGRLEFGVGRGFPFLRWGGQFVPFADRRNQDQNRALFEEVLDIVVKAWTEEAFSYDGQFYKLPVPGWIEPKPNPKDHFPPYYDENFEMVTLPVGPKPYQLPHPPIWVMSDSISSYQFAGRNGFNVLGLPRTPAELKERFEAYREAVHESFGVELPLGKGIGIQFLTYVAPTMEQAIADTAKNRSQDYMNSPYMGTPDDLIEHIESYREGCNLQLYQYRPSIGGLTFDKAIESLELFSKGVMSHFADDEPQDWSPLAAQLPKRAS